MNRRTLLLASAAPLVKLMTGPRAAGAAEPIQLVCVETEDMTDLYYAVKTGMMSRAGVDLVLIPASSGAAATTAVVAGTYQIAKTSFLPFFSAHVRGLPLVVVAPQILNEPDSPRALLQIAPDSTIKSGADLDGKIVGVPSLGDVSTLAIRAWVDKTGGDWRSLKFVEIPNTALGVAIAQHRVAAAILQTPQLDVSLESGQTKTLTYANEAIAPKFILGGYIAQADWANAHADAVRKFASTLAEASTYVNTHRAETAPLVAELTKAPLANVAKMHRTTNPTALDPALIQPLIDAAAKYGIIAHGFPAREIIWSGARS